MAGDAQRQREVSDQVPARPATAMNVGGDDQVGDYQRGGLVGPGRARRAARSRSSRTITASAVSKGVRSDPQRPMAIAHVGGGQGGRVVDAVADASRHLAPSASQVLAATLTLSWGSSPARTSVMPTSSGDVVAAARCVVAGEQYRRCCRCGHSSCADRVGGVGREVGRSYRRAPRGVAVDAHDHCGATAPVRNLAPARSTSRPSCRRSDAELPTSTTRPRRHAARTPRPGVE